MLKRICMPAFALPAIVALAVGCGGNADGSGSAGDPDLVLRGAIVRTVDPGNPAADAVAVTDGRISAVGGEAAVMAGVGPGTEVVNLDGGAVVPGFVDSHLHAVEAGRFAGLCYLPPSRGVRFYVGRLRKCARKQKGGGWVRGSGPFVWDLNRLGIAPRDLFDRAVPHRPVLINDSLGHAAFANSMALEKAGIRSGSPDPRGGSFVRTRSGRLNGVMLENAQNVVSDAAEPPDGRAARQNYRALERALPRIASEGITTISDAGGYWPRGHQGAWKMAERNGTLTARASNASWVYPNRPFERQVKAITALRSGERDSLLRFSTVKMYVDGIVDYGTAALDRRYGRKPAWSPGGRRGFTYFSRRQLNRYVEAFDRLGFMIHLHVWGDRATSVALDSIERARRINGADGGPHRLTHVYLADTSDIKRFRELDVTADMQLGAGAIAPGYARGLSSIIGERESSRLLPVADLLASGANVNLSSDWDADELSPLKSMERSLTRRGSRQVVPDAATALRMVTINPARSLDLDSITGSIEVDKRADLTVLDADPLAVGKSSIGEIGVRLTLLGGREVFRSASMSP